MFSKILFLSLLIVLPISMAWSRVFSFDSETVAPYINFRGGVGSMGEDPYAWQAATNYAGDEVDLIYGGEFGIYLRGGMFSLSAGILVHTFDAVAGGRASDAAGTVLYTADVEGLAYGPQLTFDYQLSKNELYLWKLIFGGGYMLSKIESTYNLTATGQPLVGGQTSFMESYRRDSPFAILGISTEFHLAASTTVSVTLGYHYDFGGQWKYGQGGRNFTGVHGQDASVVFEDGITDREIDWSYAFVQLGFNFYVDIVR